MYRRRLIRLLHSTCSISPSINHAVYLKRGRGPRHLDKGTKHLWVLVQALRLSEEQA
jgi:hypothetical protein